MPDNAMTLLEQYFAAFNAGDTDAMLDLLSDDIEHHVNQGRVRHGKSLFAEFCTHMGRCYKEQLEELVLFTNPEQTRGAAEFIVNGRYLHTDSGLPEANGQTYRLPAGSFFTFRDMHIVRVSTYYNLNEWIDQISGQPVTLPH